MSVAALLLALPFRLVLEAGPDAPPDTALSWRAWTPQVAVLAEPSAASEQVGAAAPRVLSGSLSEDAARWTILVEGESGGDAWFAVAASDATSARLAPVPVPVPELSPSSAHVKQDGPVAVTLTWSWSEALAPSPSSPSPSPSLPRELGGWQVFRIDESGEPQLVGQVKARATRFVDDVPPGEHAWALRPAFADGAAGPLGRASDPILVSPTPRP